ncbi:siderophore-interacting protein [Brevibacterium litoralis]|uniref:siderophore-interacting protein n=1 Tax=Brevibacterium litoralis TaxID=3138935 RepID=UPI0032ED579A
MHAVVTGTTRLTPGLIRVHLAEGDLADFAMPAHTDAYINVAIPPDDAPFGPVFEPAAIRESHPDVKLFRRRYTVGAWDAENHRLDVDFVVHGDEGKAGPWAANAAPGDVLVFNGPGSGYAPDPEADWHLFVGDESALPAIAASLRVLPATAIGHAFVLVDSPAHELAVEAPSGVDITWLHRTGAADQDVDLLVGALGAAAFPDGTAHSFIHGEAEEIRVVRKHLITERGFADDDMFSCSPYWKRPLTDEEWRSTKRDWVKQMKAEC